MRAALLSVGWAAMLLRYVTLQWVPDCGGISYGFPLPYLQTSLASSLEFQWFALPWVVDLSVYALTLLLPAWLVARGLRRRARWARALLLTPLLLPWFTLLLLALLVGLRLYSPSLFANEPLRVHEWRSVRPYVGEPAWDLHLEPACN